MITSMTGFGRGETSSNGISVTAELKTVNSRYLDISLRLPKMIQDRELELKEQLQQHIQRGKTNITVHADKADTGRPDITFNKNLVRGYKNMLDNLRDTAEIEEEVTLGDLMQFNDIFESREEDNETRQTVWELTLSSTEKAIDALTGMRRQEGSHLEKDLLQRVGHIEEVLTIIQKKTNGRAAEAKEQLLKRITDLIDNDKINDDRLEMEVAILVDKMDITEEIIRTQSHLKFFREAVRNEDTVGRQLNFLSQEINREINTIGSKANDSDISQYVVQAKESLEQIREQVQNVE